MPFAPDSVTGMFSPALPARAIPSMVLAGKGGENMGPHPPFHGRAANFSGKPLSPKGSNNRQ